MSRFQMHIEVVPPFALEFATIIRTPDVGGDPTIVLSVHVNRIERIVRFQALSASVRTCKTRNGFI